MINLDPLPMQDAQKFWQDKVSLSSEQFYTLADEAKVRAFAVSGIAKGAELESVCQSLQRAIDQGMKFADFQEECAAIFDRRGWTGKRAWRVDNIFRTNVQTAYNVGRYREMMEEDDRPYWQYSAINDSRVRPTHLAMNGKVFLRDHIFWETWYPPNGFQCRCGVISLSAREIERDKLSVQKDDPTGRQVELIDPKTGQKMPARPLVPDKGFAHNPGKTVWGGMVDTTGGPGLWANLPSLKGPKAYYRKMLRNVQPEEIGDFDESQFLPSGKDDVFYRSAFIVRYGEEKVLKDAAGDPVILSLRAYLVNKAPGVTEEWKFGKLGHGESIPLTEKIVSEPYEIWLTPQKNERGQVRLAKRYIGLWKTQDKTRIGGSFVCEVVDGAFQGVINFVSLKGKETLNLKDIEKQRYGLLLYKK